MGDDCDNSVTILEHTNKYTFSHSLPGQQDSYPHTENVHKINMSSSHFALESRSFSAEKLKQPWTPPKKKQINKIALK